MGGCSNMFWMFMILATLPTGDSSHVMKVCNLNSTSTGKCDVNKWTTELQKGCFRSFRRSNYIGGAKLLCDQYQGNFTLDVIPYIAPEILCIQNPVRSYFVDGIYTNGIWVTLDGSRSLNFTNFPGFKQHECKENSVLIWYPFKTGMSWYGVLKCKGLSTKAGTMCFQKFLPDCWSPDQFYQDGVPAGNKIAASAVECQQFCAATKGCIGFLYLYKKNALTGWPLYTCFALTSVDGTLGPSPGLIFGPASCPN